MFTVNSDNSLIEAGTDSVGLNQTGGASVALTAGQSVYVEVLGTESSPGYRDQGVYVLNASLS